MEPPHESFGRVLLERRGNEGRVTVRGWPPASVLATPLLAVAVATNVVLAAVVVYAPAQRTLHWVLSFVGAALAVAATVFASLEPWVQEVRELEVYEVPGESSDDYRTASTRSTLRLRAPGVDVPVSDVRNVTRTTWRVKRDYGPDEDRSAVFVVLPRKVLRVVELRKTTDGVAFARAIASLLQDAPLRTPNAEQAPTSYGSLAAGPFGVVCMLLALTPMVMDDASLVVRVGSLLSGAGLLLLACLAVLPLVARRVDRKTAVKYFDMAS